MPARPAEMALAASVGEVEVGAAAVDITPERDLYLGGFDLARPATGVHSRLEARAMVIRAGGVRVALVGVDNLGLQRDDVEWIKSGITGFRNGCVFVCSSHTHAAPDLVGFWGYYFLTSGRDRDYLRRVRDGVCQAVQLATERLRPATLIRGEALLPPRGLVRNSNRTGLFDRRFTVVQARDRATGAPLAALLHMACHPEALRRRNTMVSADFVGSLCDAWSAAGLGQPVFVNGALGAMISPEPQGEEGVAEMGAALFEVAQRALAAARPLPVTEIEVRRRDVYLPLTSPGLLLGRLTLAIPRRAYDDHMRTTVGYLRLGALQAVSVPGEVEPTLAERWRRRTGVPDLLLFGLCDDEVGYLMRTVDARDPEFAYERLMSPCVDAGARVEAALIGGAAASARW